MEHSYRYRLRFGGPIWLPKLPSIFPRVFENFQATDRSISHARRYRFPKIATGNRTILVSLSMFCAGHRWYMWGHATKHGLRVPNPISRGHATKHGLQVASPNSGSHATKRGLRVPNPNSRGHATKHGLRVPHPRLLGGPKEGGSAMSPLHSRGSPKQWRTKSEKASPLPSQGPKRGWKCYITPAFLGVPTKGTKSEVKTYARGHNDAPTISKHGSLVQLDAQIAALR